MNKETKPQYVTADMCQDRHGATKWILGVLLGLVAVFLTGAIYAITCANNAIEKANRVSATVETHVATQAEMERHVVQRLEEIKGDVREQRVMLQELLKNNKDRK